MTFLSDDSVIRAVRAGAKRCTEAMSICHVSARVRFDVFVCVFELCAQKGRTGCVVVAAAAAAHNCVIYPMHIHQLARIRVGFIK